MEDVTRSVGTILKQKLKTKQEKDDMLVWMSNIQAKNEVGQLIEFYWHNFLTDIYADLSPELVCLKSAQIGFSTMAIFKTAYLSDRHEMRIIYTLPTDDDVKDFVISKVNKIVKENPDIMRSMGFGRDRVDNVHVKQFGKGESYFRGTWTEKAAIMLSSDLNIYDELDRSNLKTVEVYESRLEHSAYRWQWWFSNPSAPNQGVDKFWHDSCQYTWHIRCSHCNYPQFISWPDSIDYDQEIYVCKRCRRELTPEDRRNGFWVPAKRDIERPGYWISNLMAPWVPASRVCKQYREKDPQIFWNFTIGLPYKGTLRVITENILLSHLDQRGLPSFRNVSIGVDQNGTPEAPILNTTVGNHQGVWEIVELYGWNELENMIRRTAAGTVVVDGNPDRKPILKLRDEFPGQVFAAFYRNDPKELESVRWFEDKGHVLIARDQTISNVIDRIYDGELTFYMRRDYPNFPEFCSHWESLYMGKMTDKQGTERYVWMNSGPDHYAHSTVYFMVARDRQGNYYAEEEQEVEERRSLAERITSHRPFIPPASI